MSEENVARQPISLGVRGRRTLEERLLARSPRFLRASGRAFMRLAPTSRLRRSLVGRRTRQIYEALNRGDKELFVLLGNHPDVEVHPAKDEAEIPFGADFEDVYYGHRGLLAYIQRWEEAWEESRYDVEELIDCGDRLCMLLRLRGRGRGSGIEVDRPYAQVLTLHDGFAVKIKAFWDHAEALEAAGLSE